jgi:hypothetical protein
LRGLLRHDVRFCRPGYCMKRFHKFSENRLRGRR